jgi:hypothetical protein
VVLPEINAMVLMVVLEAEDLEDLQLLVVLEIEKQEHQLPHHLKVIMVQVDPEDNLILEVVEVVHLLLEVVDLVEMDLLMFMLLDHLIQ